VGLGCSVGEGGFPGTGGLHYLGTGTALIPVGPRTALRRAAGLGKGLVAPTQMKQGDEDQRFWSLVPGPYSCVAAFRASISGPSRKVVLRHLFLLRNWLRKRSLRAVMKFLEILRDTSVLMNRIAGGLSARGWRVRALYVNCFERRGRQEGSYARVSNLLAPGDVQMCEGPHCTQGVQGVVRYVGVPQVQRYNVLV
jgi:hypothetical protein